MATATKLTYDFSTAKPVCIDEQKKSYEVRALGSDGKWWTVSDDGDMSYDFAVHLAADTRTHAGDE